MKPLCDLAAERVAAQHCAELLGVGRAPFDLVAGCAEFAAELVLALPARLEPLLLGARITATDWPAQSVTADALASSWSAPSIHFAVSLGADLPRFVLSFDNALALALTDRLFGGRGDNPGEEVPKVLPQSASLALERLVHAVAETLAPLCGAEDSAPGLMRHAVLQRLGVFRRTAACLSWSVTIEQQGNDPWNLSLAVEEAAFRPVLAQRATGAPAPRARADAPAPAAALGAIPLTLTAVLAELAMPLEQLAQLQPGTTIPFAPRRTVPLMAGRTVIANGTVGALDERIALRLTQLS